VAAGLLRNFLQGKEPFADFAVRETERTALDFAYLDAAFAHQMGAIEAEKVLEFH